MRLESLLADGPLQGPEVAELHHNYHHGLVIHHVSEALHPKDLLAHIQLRAQIQGETI